jgi:crotonobetaine/carnitine-CoA ligase
VVGFAWTFLPVLWAGGTVVLQPRFSASRYWPAALEHGCTVASQVVFTSRVLAELEVPPHSFRQWTVARHVPEDAARFRVAEVSAWGMTEMVAQPIVGDPWSPQRPLSIGRPSVGYEIAVEHDDGRPVGPGETGHLLVRGERGLSIFQEYFGDPEATAAAFDERGYFRTGDRVVLHSDGWIQFADRTKDVIKVGGEGVSASEIEGVIAGLPGVAAVAVVGKPDSAYGEVPVAFVVGDGTSAASEDALRELVLEACRSSLAKFKVPRTVVFVQDLPRVGFGKIAKAKLRESLAQRDG